MTSERNPEGGFMNKYKKKKKKKEKKKWKKRSHLNGIPNH